MKKIMRAAVLSFLCVFCNLIKQPLGILPSETGIGDRLSVAVFAHLLAAGFDVALDHQALDQIFDGSRVSSAVKNLFGNADLFHVFLIGIGVVGIHDTGRIVQAAFGVKLLKQNQIFKMVVRNALAVLVDRTAENGMSQRIAAALYLPATVCKIMALLCRNDGVQHNG